MTAAVERRAAPVAARRIAIGALALWGVVHIIGGAVLVATGFQGATTALTTLGTGLDPAPGPVDGAAAAAIEGLVRFHGLNILLGGVAVTALAIRARTSWSPSMVPALLIVATLDLGLVAFLLLPGVMAVGDGLPGPVLLAVVLAATWRVGLRSSAADG